jgi:hypothetical protein
VQAGYSDTPLRRKLGIKPGARVVALGAPDGFDAALAHPAIAHRLAGRFDVIVCFVTSRQALERRLPALLRAREERGTIWIAWPKRASGVATDLADTLVREAVLETGLVDNKVCAIDEEWSGLRFVARRA